LDALIAAAGPPEVPPDLGNFPAPRSASAPGGDPPDEEPSPVVPPPETVPAPPADDDDDGEEAGAIDPRVQKQLDDIARENEFLRLAIRNQSAPQAPPQPSMQTPQDAMAAIDQVLGGYQVTPEDLDIIRAGDPARAAQYLQNGIRAAAAAGAALALRQARAEYQTDQSQQRSATDLRTLMYSKHPNLEPWADMVQAHATRLYQQMPNTDAQTLVDATARSVKGFLSSQGIDVDRTEPAQPRPQRRQPTRLRPAFAEGGGGGRSQGRGGMTQFERDVFQLVNAR
jgi:hypothetical protein